MFENFRLSLAIFAAGSFIAIIAGFLADLQFDDTFKSLMVGLIVELLIIALSISTAIVELRAQIFEWLEANIVLIKAAGIVSKTRDEVFSHKYRNIYAELEDLSRGTYQLKNIHEVYDDDIRSAQQLQKSDSLHSMCPILGSSADAEKQLKLKDFIASMEAHKRAVKRGVNVHRLYLIQNKETFDSELIKTHLQQNVANGIRTFFLLMDDDRSWDETSEVPDFVIFGDKKVSVCKVSNDHKLHGGQVFADRAKITDYRDEYRRLLRRAEEVKLDELQEN